MDDRSKVNQRGERQDDGLLIISEQKHDISNHQSAKM